MKKKIEKINEKIQVVNVYRLITQGTLEEKIMSLQQFKMKTTNSVINEENSSLSKMDTSKLLDLFEVSSNKEVIESNEKQDDDNDLSHPLVDQNLPLKGMSDIWDDKEQYEEFNFDNFLSKLKKK